jgi:hypothetical protein
LTNVCEASLRSDFLYPDSHKIDGLLVTIMDDKTLREYLFKEVEIVQDIITRMGTNSFLVKGWAITLVVASLLITGFSYHHFVAFLPWLIFWAYDAYFLRMEKLYRKLNDWLVNNRSKSEEFLLDMNKSSLENRFGKETPCLQRVMFSKTLIVFYGVLLVMIVLSVTVDLLQVR